MALDFPSSPTNNQVYENYIYNSTSGAWQKLPGNTFATTAISDTPPVNPANGDLWWNSADGKFYIYYSDGSSAQWVSAALPAVAVSDTPPAGYDGQMWLDSTDGSMYVYYTDPGGASSSWIGAVSRSGGILQVVSTTKTDVFTTASASFTDVTGLSATITPRSSSSKVLVLASLVGVGDPGAIESYVRLARNGAAIAVGNADGNRIQAWSNQYGANADVVLNTSPTFLDSPGTTSSVTYSVQVRLATAATGTFFVNRSDSDANDNRHGRFASTITLMEVAG